MLSKLTESTWIPFSLAVLMASGFAYVKGIDKDVLAAQDDLKRHDVILESIPVIREDIAGIKQAQEDLVERMDRMGEFLQQ